MEELLRAAVAYYNNGSNDLRATVTEFFNSMDTNHDDLVSRSEFRGFLEQNGYNINSRVFNGLDRNGDGYLEFEEVLALYYIIKTRLHRCDHCGLRLLGLYFTCVVCFDRAGNTYDLCCTCYSERRFRHNSRHTVFMDNHMLLIAKRNQANGSNILNQAIAPAPSRASSSRALVPAQQTAHRVPVSTRTRIAFQTLEAAIRIGHLIAACTIM